MKLLQIYNFASHYRTSVYQMIEEKLGADSVFGDKAADIKPMDYTLLQKHIDIVHNIYFRFGYYQKGVLKYILKDYDTYLLSGEFRCVSTWILLICLRLLPHKKSYIWTHGWLGKENRLKRIVTKTFFNLSDGIFVYNDRSRKLMIEGGIPSGKIVTIYNSLDYDTQLLIRKELHPSDIYNHYFGNNNQVIIYIGRLTAVKKLNWLIDALDILHGRGEKYNLVIVGDGNQRESLEERIVEKGLSHFTWFYGACYDESKNAEFIYNADLCVSPGNVGLTAIHTMMYGCPVITNDDFNHQMPEFETIRKGRTGDFFMNGSIDSLAECIHHWITNFQNRERIRQACYQEIDKKWTPHNQIKILRHFL